MSEQAPVVTPVTPVTSAPSAPSAPSAAPENTGNEPVSTPFYQNLPDTWRDQMVTGLDLGESEANVLNRYTDFGSFGKAFFEQHKKIRQGVTQSDALPENATEEQVSEYRAANGIPEAPEGYKATMPEGFVPSDEDERILGAIWNKAHALNVKPETLAPLQQVWFEARVEEEQRELHQHGLDLQSATKTMKDHWGADYETNINAILGLLNTLPEEVKLELEHGVGSSGVKLFNHPEVIQAFATIARELNPAMTVVPNSSNPTQAISSEIKKIEEIRDGDEPDKYWKDAKMQARYLELLTAQEQMLKNNAA